MIAGNGNTATKDAPIYSGPRIDSDVHHTWASEEDLLSYLPQSWRNVLERPDGSGGSLAPAQLFFPLPFGTNKRLDAFPPNGGPPGSDYETMKQQLLDPFNMHSVMLSFDIGLNPGLPNVYLAAEVARAANDWSIEQWLSVGDDRLKGAMLVSTHLPDDAVKEIKRVGTHPRVAEVLLVSNGLGRPFGHPIYHPIFETAVEYGLPVAIHIGGEQVLPGGAHHSAGGLPNSRLEMHALLAQTVMHHLVSFIVHGVFEKFSALRLMLVECGVAWIPGLLWKLDDLYDDLRRENTCIKKRPSEYFRQHVRVTTQPLEEAPQKEQLIDLLESFGGMDEILCFSTDYPHWDTDDPDYVSRKLPSEWLDKVMYRNAADFYGFPTAGAEMSKETI